MSTIPLFPLNTVLFPDGILPLRIFEPRYVDMVSECMRLDSGFGVCLISEGPEAGKVAECHEIGTLARIIDWDNGDDGLLGITTQGMERFRILTKHVRSNQLLEGNVEFIDEDDPEEIPVEYQLMADLLRKIGEKFELPYQSEHEKFMDAAWVGCRLAELLPIEPDDRQLLLEINDPILRLKKLQVALEHVNTDEFTA